MALRISTAPFSPDFPALQYLLVEPDNVPGRNVAAFVFGPSKQMAKLLKVAEPKHPKAAKAVGQLRGDVAYLQWIEVSARGGGLGSEMLQAGLDALSGLPSFLFASNEALVPWYERYGFVRSSPGVGGRVFMTHAAE